MQTTVSEPVPGSPTTVSAAPDRRFSRQEVTTSGDLKEVSDGRFYLADEVDREFNELSDRLQAQLAGHRETARQATALLLERDTLKELNEDLLEALLEMTASYSALDPLLTTDQLKVCPNGMLGRSRAALVKVYHAVHKGKTTVRNNHTLLRVRQISKVQL